MRELAHEEVSRIRGREPITANLFFIATCYCPVYIGVYTQLEGVYNILEKLKKNDAIARFTMTIDENRERLGPNESDN